MKRFIFIILVLTLTLTFFPAEPQGLAFAQELEKNFKVYNEQGQLLCERVNPAVGDIIITKYFDEYEIYLVDETELIAKAKFIKTLEKPKITKRPKTYSDKSNNKFIAMYMTHNDESYILGDGIDSVYGPGGIHDIAKALKRALETKGIKVTLDEKLHIPHNSSAYTRSAVTAKELLALKPDALFDIHRDGVTDSYYRTFDDRGKPKSKVRITVGQRNPNKDENLKLALYLMSVAEVECPWLFNDIYFASGNYNQDLYSKALLFEMGTYLIEKEYVLNTVMDLAKVIDTTLYNTSVNESGQMIINPSENEKGESINSSLSTGSSQVVWSIVISVALLIAAGVMLVFFVKEIKKKGD